MFSHIVRAMGHAGAGFDVMGGVAEVQRPAQQCKPLFSLTCPCCSVTLITSRAVPKLPPKLQNLVTVPPKGGEWHFDQFAH